VLEGDPAVVFTREPLFSNGVASEPLLPEFAVAFANVVTAAVAFNSEICY